MKLLKLSIILLFMQLLFFTSLSAQEGENTNTGSGGEAHDNSSGAIAEPLKNEGIVNKEKNSTITPDSTNKEKFESNNVVQKKSSIKNKSEIKPVQKVEDIKTEDEKNDKPDAIKIDEGLLLIDEGNFKYRRIPEIKLVDKIPEMAEKSIEAEMPAEPDQKKETSYIDIWKILVILIIVGICILYMSRASGPPKVSNKNSKSRKVLNSYRK
ncbi:MAG: hypothetical protein FWF73_02145 [Spirochaetes bacterium]|nr:hypothetical protein [Spirochaetota bacterium]